MKIFFIQMKYDNNKTRRIMAERAETDASYLSFFDDKGNPVGRFELGKVENWWQEDGEDKTSN